MEKWTAWNLIAYIFIGTCAFLNALAAAKEKPPLSDWLSPFLKTYILGYGPAICFIIATMFFIIQAVSSKKGMETEKDSLVLRAPSTTSQPTPEIVKPKKFYSDREKSDLSNALRDLSQIINIEGTNITQKAQQISIMWTLETRKVEAPDTTALIEQLNDLNKLTIVFKQILYGENSFMHKNRVYSDEFNSILQIQKNTLDSPFNPISILQESIRIFRDQISSIDLAKKYNDQQLINSMKTNLQSPFQNYVNEYQHLEGGLLKPKNVLMLFVILIYNLPTLQFPPNSKHDPLHQPPSPGLLSGSYEFFRSCKT